MGSGLVLFTYITAHLVNHALGLISLHTAEEGLGYAEDVWDTLPGTVLLYGAALIHFLLALWSIYERRTFRLPPAELLRQLSLPDHQDRDPFSRATPNRVAPTRYQNHRRRRANYRRRRGRHRPDYLPALRLIQFRGRSRMFLTIAS